MPSAHTAYVHICMRFWATGTGNWIQMMNVCVCVCVFARLTNSHFNWLEITYTGYRSFDKSNPTVFILFDDWNTILFIIIILYIWNAENFRRLYVADGCMPNGIDEYFCFLFFFSFYF